MLPGAFPAPEEAPLQLDLADGLGRSGRRGFDRELTLQGLRNGGYFDMPIQVSPRLLRPSSNAGACSQMLLKSSAEGASSRNQVINGWRHPTQSCGKHHDPLSCVLPVTSG